MSNSPHNKMLRSRRQWYRCPSHGQHCVVTEEVRGIPFSKAQEREEIRQEIESDINELLSEDEYDKCEHGVDFEDMCSQCMEDWEIDDIKHNEEMMKNERIK